MLIIHSGYLRRIPEAPKSFERWGGFTSTIYLQYNPTAFTISKRLDSFQTPLLGGLECGIVWQSGAPSMSILNISDWKLIPSQHIVHTYIVSRALTGAAVRRSRRDTGKLLPSFLFSPYFQDRWTVCIRHDCALHRVRGMRAGRLGCAHPFPLIFLWYETLHEMCECTNLEP